MLYPAIRVQRAMASSLLFPNHPIEAVAITEIVGTILPLLNPPVYKQLIGYVYWLICTPLYTINHIYLYERPQSLKYYYTELIGLLLLIIYNISL